MTIIAMTKEWVVVREKASLFLIGVKDNILDTLFSE
jgi:hypothetical protein